MENAFFFPGPTVWISGVSSISFPRLEESFLLSATKRSAFLFLEVTGSPFFSSSPPSPGSFQARSSL